MSLHLFQTTSFLGQEKTKKTYFFNPKNGQRISGQDIKTFKSVTTERMLLILEMTSNQQIDIEIDKLTRSVENAVTGDSFKTEILPLATKDIKLLNKNDWLFDWKAEVKNKDKLVYKLTH